MMAAILAREQAAATARPNASSAAENSSSAVIRRLHQEMSRQALRVNANLQSEAGMKHWNCRPYGVQSPNQRITGRLGCETEHMHCMQGLPHVGAR